MYRGGCEWFDIKMRWRNVSLFNLQLNVLRILSVPMDINPTV